MQYIIHYEIWKDGKGVQWGNSDVACARPPTASELRDAICKNIAEELQCKLEHVRLLGIFKI